MNEKTRLQKLGRSELEALAEKALTNQERNRQASAKVRQAKKAAGLQQISVWVPRGSPSIEKIRKFADELCEKHLAALEAQANSPKKSDDLRGQNQAQETPKNPPPHSAHGQED
ncbi:hypothetical protein [Palleronia sp.]|uniref:hypothetical protein n=1 Tax=Palleronia sp. TaxID=1940284 RepID=UPI0035C8171E